MAVGDIIKMLREQRGVGQQDLCNYLNIEQSTLANYENNRRTPKLDIVSKIADYFQVTTDFLLERKNTEKEILPSLSPKEINEISKEAEKVREYINASLMTAFDGKPKDEETLEKVMNALEYGMQLAKQEAKEKYTPKKYKNDKSNND